MRRALPAILLRSHPYGDTSQILRFLTPDLGIVAVVAKGVRAQHSKGRGGGLELFARGTLDVDHRPGRALHGFRGFEADPDHPVRGLAHDMLALAGASYLAELLLAHGVDEEPQTVLFPYLSQALGALAGGLRAELPWIFLRTGWGVLGLLGFPPALDRCVACDVPVGFNPEALVRFDLEAGGIRCARCAEGGAGPRLGPKALAGLRELAGSGAGDAQSLSGGDFSRSRPVEALPVEGALGLFRLLDRFARLHLGLERTFRSTEAVEASITALISGDSRIQPG
jgi:DNA repair protein RecO